MIFNHPALVCAFSNKKDNNMSLVYGDTEGSLENRKRYLKELGIDYQDLVCTQQVHTSKVTYVQETDRGKGALSYGSALANTDALITNQRNLPLAIFTADCLPIFLYDPVRIAIGLIHAGWQGSRKNITTKTLKLMQDRFNSRPQDLSVGFGPALRSCCYKVGEEFKRFFPKDLIKKNRHYYLDIIEINKRQLLDSGIREQNISDREICTSCQNETFFSYRNEGESCDRMISVMILK